MTTVDPAASIARANSVDRWRGSGLCLDFVDWSMGRPGSRLADSGLTVPNRATPPNGNWMDAKDGYYFSNHKHPGDMNPPPGVPCYWETGPSGNTAGHIVISLGDGWCRTTDYAGVASVSTASIAWLTDARNGGYLGWTADYGGNPIAGIASLAAETITPIEEEEDMKCVLITADGSNIYVTNGVTKRILVDGPEIDSLFSLDLIQARDGKPRVETVAPELVDRIPDLTRLTDAIGRNLL